MWRFFSSNKHKIITMAGAALCTAAETSWAWAGQQMGTSNEQDQDKYFWALFMLLISMGFIAVGGHANDKLSGLIEGIAPRPGCCGKHVGKTLGGILGVSWAFVSSYFIFTDIGMAGNAAPEWAKKFLYILAKLIGGVALGVEEGKVLDDVLRLVSKNELNQEGYRRFDDDDHIIHLTERRLVGVQGNN